MDQFIILDYIDRCPEHLNVSFRMRMERISGHSQYFLLHLCTQVIFCIARGDCSIDFAE